VAALPASASIGIEPVWATLLGGALLAATRCRPAGSGRPAMAADPLFCLFVLALGMIVV
jgi:hypothetical protein